MRKPILFHDSHSSLYRVPFGAVPCGQEIVLRLRVISSNRPDRVAIRLWEHEKGEIKLVMRLSPATKEVYEVSLRVTEEPGWLWYHFIVEIGGKSYLYGNNQEKLGGIGKEYSQPDIPAYQITVYKASAKTPAWFKDAIIYQIFIDRFNVGQDGVLNPKKGSVLHAAWDNVPYYIRDVDTKRIVYYDFFGGNLTGVMEKLVYLKDLGVSVIYFNPIFSAASNHRYDTADYHHIDSMIGDNELFAAFCAKAQEMGIAVILDGVFSHTGSDSIYFNRDKHYPSVGAYQSKHSPYYKWYRFSRYPDQYESWWGIDTLPNVDELEPSYIDFVVRGENSVVKYWQKQGVKGWRLDVADELPEEFIKEFYRTLKAQDPDAVLIGEVWEDASKKESYGKLRRYLQGEELDSSMNYPFRQILLDFFLGNKDAHLTGQAVLSLYENYPLHTFFAAMNLIGTHDVPRILTLLGEAPSVTGMSISAQTTYKLPVNKRKLGIARLKLLVLWQMTFPGVPSIYYGDEAGLEGYRDPFNRGTYPWGNEDQELIAWYKLLTGLRNKNDMLRTGNWQLVYAEGNVFCYMRQIQGGKDSFGCVKKDGTAIIVFNRCSDRPITVNIPVKGMIKGVLRDALDDHKEYKVEQDSITMKLAPLAGSLLILEDEAVFPRECGVLLHVTSLPGGHGGGDLGEGARKFIRFLQAGQQKLWQVLPLNHTGPDGSPYNAHSAFAGNPLLISLDSLVDEGLLVQEDLKSDKFLEADRFNYAAVMAYKEPLLRRAFAQFSVQDKPADYQNFIMNNEFWLKDYTLFMALKEYFSGQAWHLWPDDIAVGQNQALEKYCRQLAPGISYYTFVQYQFFRQWDKVKRYAAEHEVKIIGDLPIFVAYDSADVWANRQLFELDDKGAPTVVAGVPPDYFSETGQLWGNPLYNWAVMAKTDYAWWRERFRLMFGLFDIVRIDHFRGFEAYWQVPADEKTAIQGQWVKGPGSAFFVAMRESLGKLPVIAEDLGVITEQVEELKDQFHFPGMKVLQFIMGSQKDMCVPFICRPNTVVYTGTHDNDTTVGWFTNQFKEEPELVKWLLERFALKNADAQEVCQRLIEIAYNCTANTVIIPLQDILGLGSEARMNMPGTIDGNWQWRCRAEDLSTEKAIYLANLAEDYER